MNERSVIFGCAVSGAETEAQACLLAESIRSFGGRLSGSPVRVFGQSDGYHISDGGQATFERLNVRAGYFDLAPEVGGLPFAGKVHAAAAAEEMARGQADFLIWLDPDSLVLQEPAVLLLAQEKTLGCRPVDHLLIGSPYDRPADAFWRTVYQICGVRQASLFPMTTSTDEIRIRPYINAGMLVVRPEAGLLGMWRDRLRQAIQSRVFEPFFEQNNLYRIFLHQAILAGTVLANLTQKQIQILPHLVNYPLHMYQQVPAKRQPSRMNDMISGRYDTLFRDPEWPRAVPIDEPLRGWLAHKLAAYCVATRG